MTLEDVTAFYQDWKEDKLEPDTDTDERKALAYMKEPFIYLTKKTYYNVVNNPDADVLVFFYASYEMDQQDLIKK